KRPFQNVTGPARLPNSPRTIVQHRPPRNREPSLINPLRVFAMLATSGISDFVCVSNACLLVLPPPHWPLWPSLHLRRGISAARLICYGPESSHTSPRPATSIASLKGE